MPIIIPAALALQAVPATPPPCGTAQLRLYAGPREGVADFAPRAGMLLNILNLGTDCMIPALPTVTLRDGRGRPLPISRRPSPGMHPGPAMLPVELTGGHHVSIEVAWTPCPRQSRRPCARVGGVGVRIGTGTLEAPVSAAVAGAPDGSFRFDQTPARVAEGMAEG